MTPTVHLKANRKITHRKSHKPRNNFILRKNGMIFEYGKHSLASTIRQLYQRRSEIADFKQRAHESGRPYLWSQIEPVFIDAIAGLTKGERA